LISAQIRQQAAVSVLAQANQQPALACGTIESSDLRFALNWRDRISLLAYSLKPQSLFKVAP
jgi:hypothetical protein